MALIKSGMYRHHLEQMSCFIFNFEKMTIGDNCFG